MAGGGGLARKLETLSYLSLSRTLTSMQTEYAVLHQRNLIAFFAFAAAVLYLFAYFIHMFFTRRKVLALQIIAQREMGLETFIVVSRWMNDLEQLTVGMTWLTIFNFSIFLLLLMLLYNDFLYHLLAAQHARTP